MNLPDILVGFDLDDTLISEYGYLHSAFRIMADRFHSVPLAELRDNFRRFNDALEAIPDSSGRERMRTLYHNGDIPVTALPGTISLLSELKGMGATLAIVTDGFGKRQRNKLLNAGIESFFDITYISGEFENRDKLTGFPFAFLRQKKRFRKMFYIGDNPAKDFIEARREGFVTIMVRNPEMEYVHPETVPSPEYAPDFTVASLQEVLPLIIKLCHTI